VSLTGDAWEYFNVGLGDNQVKSLATDGQFLLAGTEDGLFKWDPTAGNAWTRVNNGLEGVVVTGICVENSNEMYLASISDGVLYTQDGGTTWTYLQNGLELAAGNRVQSVAWADQALIASTQFGLYLSADLQTWKRVGDKELTDVRHTLATNDQWFVTTSKGVYITTDFGNTFNQGQDLHLSFLTEKVTVKTPENNAVSSPGVVISSPPTSAAVAPSDYNTSPPVSGK
jgi:ligand-binding sensor domain-containing protein